MPLQPHRCCCPLSSQFLLHSLSHDHQMHSNCSFQCQEMQATLPANRIDVTRGSYTYCWEERLPMLKEYVRMVIGEEGGGGIGKRGSLCYCNIAYTLLILLILQICFREQALNFKCLHKEKSFRVISAPQYLKMFICLVVIALIKSHDELLN